LVGNHAFRCVIGRQNHGQNVTWLFPQESSGNVLLGRESHFWFARPPPPCHRRCRRRTDAVSHLTPITPVLSSFHAKIYLSWPIHWQWMSTVTITMLLTLHYLRWTITACHHWRSDPCEVGHPTINEVNLNLFYCILLGGQGEFIVYLQVLTNSHS
jgi:hypothetical protein